VGVLLVAANEIAADRHHVIVQHVGFDDVACQGLPQRERKDTDRAR